MSNTRSTKERHIALLTYLRQTHPTMKELMRLPFYAHSAGEKTLKRMIMRDLSELRQSGYRIDVTSDFRYVLDQSPMITVSGFGCELGMLRSFLDVHRGELPETFAQSAIHKLLADADATVEGIYQARVPSGNQVVAIADAITRQRRVAFTYRSRHGDRRYVLEPWQISVHFDAFYVRGEQVSLAGRRASGVRIFKLDRIVDEVEILGTRIESTPVPSESVFSPIDAVVDVRAGTCRPLYARANGRFEPSQVHGWDRLTLETIARDELFELLMFYGIDARIVAPLEAREDFLARLTHAIEVSQ
ncbi:proteasome accessory factor B [Arcanobacterium wilhelmae]|uniref:Proteasome accessory factor B n=1 Tax=Arcanobacterium wilhelmae TaxID=1803177 RepID=A0ABT9N8J3_9ACTO|nr:WYL domain-containing protein [Arcanobacterium wilhelmae]MDP9800020.1 proteasome accessory factor B [Arcanobacterium wilhelmae]WFN89517.1 WYL domain-containing protein [Arcanobacterium wilhelmae]